MAIMFNVKWDKYFKGLQHKKKRNLEVNIFMLKVSEKKEEEKS